MRRQILKIDKSKYIYDDNIDAAGAGSGKTLDAAINWALSCAIRSRYEFSGFHWKERRCEQDGGGDPRERRHQMKNAAAALRRPIAQARGLPSVAYTGDEFFELEQQCLFARIRPGPPPWTCIAFAHEVPEPGDAMPMMVAGLARPIILLRDDKGKIRSFHNVCRHRATMVLQRGRTQSKTAANFRPLSSLDLQARRGRDSPGMAFSGTRSRLPRSQERPQRKPSPSSATPDRAPMPLEVCPPSGHEQNGNSAISAPRARPSRGRVIRPAAASAKASKPPSISTD